MTLHSFCSHIPLLQALSLSFSSAAKEERSLALQRPSEREGAREDPTEGGRARDSKGKAAPATKTSSPTPQVLFLLLLIFLQLLFFLFLLTFTATRDEGLQNPDRTRQKNRSSGGEEGGRGSEKTLLLLTGPVQRLVTRSSLRQRRLTVGFQALGCDLQKVSSWSRNLPVVTRSQQEAGGTDRTCTARTSERHKREGDKCQQESCCQEQQLQLLFLLLLLFILFLLVFILLLRQFRL